MIAACILIKDKVVLKNVPDIIDIRKICQILEKLGADISRSDHTVTIDCTNLQSDEPDENLVKAMRASVVLIGPMLARFGQAKIVHPGGDKIGSRPIDRHIKAFEELGVAITSRDNYYEFKYLALTSHEVSFSDITVTGTENILLFAAGINEQIIIDNAAIEPEIIDLINFLNKAGTEIKVKNRQIIVKGNSKMHQVEHTVIPDRIEAGTFIILAIASNSKLKINNLNSGHLSSLLNLLENSGAKFDVGQDFVYIKEFSNLRPFEVSTDVYPGLSTDWQPPLGVLATQISGQNRIRENIFENRLGYLKELQDMGAKVKIIDNQTALVDGPSQLHGAEIKSLDIRAGATLIIAGIIAKGETVIENAQNIDRGYERIEERLNTIGAKIKRI